MGVRSHRALEAVGRLGGDEFVALLPEVADEADAERVAQRILEVMREPIFVAARSASSPPAWASPCTRATASRWPT
jgi:GGDEF domain-containing protein